MTDLVKNIPIVGADGEVLSETPENQTGEPMPFQDFDFYQMCAEQTNVTPPENRLVEILTGLSEELGEFMSFHKRMMRGDYKTEEEQTEALHLAKKELGDMLWYMSAWCTIHRIPFGDVPFTNLEKLSKRMEQNQITGEGDERELKDVNEESSSPVESEGDKDE